MFSKSLEKTPSPTTPPQGGGGPWGGGGPGVGGVGEGVFSNDFENIPPFPCSCGTRSFYAMASYFWSCQSHHSPAVQDMAMYRNFGKDANFDDMGQNVSGADMGSNDPSGPTAQMGLEPK